MSGISKITTRLYQRVLSTSITTSFVSSALKIVRPIISTPLCISSVNTLSSRKLSTSTIDSPGRRIIEHFERYPTIPERCQFMITQVEASMREDNLHNALHEFDTMLDYAITKNPEEHLKQLLTTYAFFKFELPTTRWQNYPIQHIESLSGIGQRYSTSSFAEILKYLPTLIIDQHGEKPIKFIELGGFAFNDSFLLARDFEKKGLRASGFTGVDIHQQGILAASVFNKRVAKIKNYQIINEDAIGYMGKPMNQKKFTENCVVAIRFLAVFDPVVIRSFFQNVGTFRNCS